MRIIKLIVIVAGLLLSVYFGIDLGSWCLPYK